MDFNKVFDRLSNISPIPLREQIIELLQKTWVNISVDYCTDVLRKKRPNESIRSDSIARVELFSDEARCAVYSYMNRWNGTSEQYLLEKWFDLSIEEQNSLLIEAFPDGRIYGV